MADNTELDDWRRALNDTTIKASDLLAQCPRDLPGHIRNHVRAAVVQLTAAVSADSRIMEEELKESPE